MQCSSRIKLSKLDSSVLGLVLMFLFFTFIFMRRFHILSKEGHTIRKSKKMARQNKLQILLLNGANIIVVEHWETRMKLTNVYRLAIFFFALLNLFEPKYLNLKYCIMNVPLVDFVQNVS